MEKKVLNGHVEDSQLDRIEKKMDRILELLEGKELSTSFTLDNKKVAGYITVPAKPITYTKSRLI